MIYFFIKKTKEQKGSDLPVSSDDTNAANNLPQYEEFNLDLVYKESSVNRPDKHVLFRNVINSSKYQVIRDYIEESLTQFLLCSENDKGVKEREITLKLSGKLRLNKFECLKQFKRVSKSERKPKYVRSSYIFE